MAVGRDCDGVAVGGQRRRHRVAQIGVVLHQQDPRVHGASTLAGAHRAPTDSQRNANAAFGARLTARATADGVPSTRAGARPMTASTLSATRHAAASRSRSCCRASTRRRTSPRRSPQADARRGALRAATTRSSSSTTAPPTTRARSPRRSPRATRTCASSPTSATAATAPRCARASPPRACDWVLLTDGDLQFDLDELERLRCPLARDHDLVAGYRHRPRRPAAAPRWPPTPGTA